MKRFVSAIGLCVALLLFGLFALMPTTNAQKSLLETLLDLPAPPPPNSLVVNRIGNRPDMPFDKNKAPADDVPIDDLVAYWQRVNEYTKKYSYAPEASDRTVDRLIEEAEKNPERLPSMVGAFVDKEAGVEAVKRLYDREMSEKKFEREWRESVRRWLTYNSKYFSDDLAQVANRAGDTNGYVSNQDEVLALARVDWEKARPQLDRMLADTTQPVSQTLARWAYYSHAMREKNSIEADRWRKLLQETVESKSDKPGNRDLAMDALVEAGDFEGRDDWYFSLLEDETLHDLRVNGASYTGLTTILNHSPSDKYVAKMLELARSSNPAVRSAAVRNLSTLLDDKNRDVIEALLPWLENPKWAKETSGGERRQLVSALREFQIPESVPGLIAMLNEKGTRESMNGGGYIGNTMGIYSGNMMSNGNLPMRPDTIEIESYPFRDEAISALMTQKDARAAAPLRAILPEIEDWQRGMLVRAILVSRGFSIAEQIEALEMAAKNISQAMNYDGMSNKMTNANSGSVRLEAEMDSPPIPPPRVMANMTMSNSSYVGNAAVVRRPVTQAEIQQLLAAQLVNQPDAEEELVTALINRISILDKKDPPIATGLRRIMQGWNGAAINRLLLQDLKNNRINADAVVKLLSLRKELREKQWSDVADIRTGGATALGISACLIEDANEYDAILSGDNVEAKVAMLGCARLIRAQLPVPKVAENLTGENKILVTAAERYLISEDSPEARRIILARHPNEMMVLGARGFFSSENTASSDYLSMLFASVNPSALSEAYYLYGGFDDHLAANEGNLRKELKENQELFGVYSYDNNYVRIYRDRAVYSWQEDKARYRERDLEANEFDQLKAYLAGERVDELPPFLANCYGEETSECDSKELLMLGRQGGRRVYSLGAKQKFFTGLEEIFDNFRQPPARLHYWMEKGVKGLEILFEDPNLQAEAVWKTGADLRVLINNQARRKEIDSELDKQIEVESEKLESYEGDEDVYEKYTKIEQEQRKRREQREFENYAWYRVNEGRLGETVAQPDGIEFLPRLDGAPVRADSNQWKARAAQFELRSTEDGVYKIQGGRATKIRQDYLGEIVMTTNGRWVVGVRYNEEVGRQFVRVNMQTNKEFAINFEEYPTLETVVYVPSLNRILMFGGSYNEYERSETDDYTDREGEFYLLDPETGALQKAKGEARPLAQQTYRPLQTNGKPDEFWAAIPDAKADNTQVGIYNAKTLSFKSVAKIPQITFNSMQMWVDGGTIYFVYEGHLLSLPLSKETPVAQ